MIYSIIRDLQTAIRQLISQPGSNIIIILTLSFGIGANTAIFSVVNGVLLRSLPFDNSNRIVELRQRGIKEGRENIGMSVKEIDEYSSKLKNVNEIIEYHYMNFSYIDENPAVVKTGIVSSNFFKFLGINPILGRTFTAEDEILGSEPMIVLSNKFWRNHYSMSSSVIGKIIEMNGKAHKIIGVLPQFPSFPQDNDIYATTIACPTRSSDEFIARRESRMMSVYGHVSDAVSMEDARSEVSHLSKRMYETFPNSYPDRVGYRTDILVLEEELTRDIKAPLLILQATTLLVLLIACANVVNLSLAQQTKRERELSIRTALGANRSRIVRQLLTESILKSLIGGMLGLFLAILGIDYIYKFIEQYTSKAYEAQIDIWVLLFTLIISIGTGVIVGLVPALGKRDFVAYLKNGSMHATAGGEVQKVRGTLTVIQTVIAFVLLVTAGLMLRSLIVLQSIDPGFNPDNIIAATIPLNRVKHTPSSMRNFLMEIDSSLKNNDAIDKVALTTSYPFAMTLNSRRDISRIVFDDRAADNELQGERVNYRSINDYYFNVLDIDLVSGRNFTENDSGDAPKVAIVSKSMADRYWDMQNPTGKRFSPDKGDTWLTVVGVVPDVKQYGLNQDTTYDYYLPFLQAPSTSLNFLIKTRLTESVVSDLLQGLVRNLDPQQPITEVVSLEDAIDRTLTSPKLISQLLGMFALVSVIITVGGISALIAYSASQRTKEIGIRVTFGAETSSIQWLIMRQGLFFVVLGLILGIIISSSFGSLLQSLIYGISPWDFGTYLMVSIILFGAAVVACWIPAVRASTMEPVNSLRTI